MITVNLRPQLNNKNAVNFGYNNRSLTPDNIVRYDRDAFKTVLQGDFASGEESFMSLLQYKIGTLFALIFDPEIAVKGKAIEKQLKEIVQGSSDLGERLDLTA